MANMSYCRFHNTRIDMADCLNALKMAYEEDYKIGRDEIQNCKWMFRDILNFLYQKGVIEEFDVAFEKWCRELNKFAED